MVQRRTALVVTGVLGVLAASLGAFHGLGEVLQGEAVPLGLVINAWGGPDCPPAGTANCFPAMSVLPTNFLVLGIATLIVAVLTLLATVVTLRGVGRGLWLLLASVALLLVGGGFLPPLLGGVGAGSGYLASSRVEA